MLNGSKPKFVKFKKICLKFHITEIDICKKIVDDKSNLNDYNRLLEQQFPAVVFQDFEYSPKKRYHIIKCN